MGKIVYLTAPHLPVQVERQRRGTDVENGCSGNETISASSGAVYESCGAVYESCEAVYESCEAVYIIGGRPWDPGVVLDCCPQALEAGVYPGMDLAQAAMRYPEARFLPADTDTYHTVQQLVDTALRQFTDRIETAGLGIWYVDVADMERMYPEDNDLAERILQTAREHSELTLQLGMANSRFAAQQAGYTAAPNTAVIIPPRRDGAFLSPLPLTQLPADDELLRRLDILGIHSLGALASLPRLALIRQFGSFAGLLHDMAAGRDPRPVHPEAPPLELRYSHLFEPVTADIARLHARTEAMTLVIAQTLQQQGYQAQGLRIHLDDESSKRHSASGILKPPTADGAQLQRRLMVLIDRLTLTEAVESVTLVIYPLRPSYLAAAQLALFTAVQDQQLTQLQQVLQRLRERFGQLIMVIASLVGPPRPQRIQVTTDAEAAPLALVWSDRIVAVHRIYEHWRESRFWWAQPVQRYYYRVEDANGQVRIVFRDMLGKTWWLDRRRMWNTSQ
jgi:nucleotidyltransferase/DNA polymerase involved in DNA repair